ncbi:hypothetical protein BDZ94DRAFT_1269251 [Collybia nuda]|uniref:Uncharacterized protein n=1 Tax=Collybia nuda TaxID=64659 RepID=A0A9P6CFL1_9AGAR|nr:hypothetical protein BDZ94DRAFT_1269251 [Collybia nuda]
MSIAALCHPVNVDVIVGIRPGQTKVLTPSKTSSTDGSKDSGASDDLTGKKPLNDPVCDVESEISVIPVDGRWKFWKRFGKRSSGKGEAGSLSSGSSLNSGGSSASSKISIPSFIGSRASSRTIRVLDGSDKDEPGVQAGTVVTTPCGMRCMDTSNARAIMITSSYDFSHFSTVKPPRIRPGEPRPARTPAVPCSRICHTPVYLVRSHWAPKVENSVLEFAVPGACKRTLGVGIEELLVYHGQCIVGAQEPIPSELLGEKKGKVVISVKLKGNAPSQKYHMTVQCECGTPITRGGLAAKLAAAYMDYLGPHRVLPVRLKSLSTEDGGITWRAQHAIVMKFRYDNEPGLRLPAAQMITKIKWT